MSGAYDRKDQLYLRAKSEGYRSRAAFKLTELNERHKFIKQGFSILDLGAWPGGWLQVAAQLVGNSGRVVGIDLVTIEALTEPVVKTITGDARDEESINTALSYLGPNKSGFDVVLSDMSPKLTGTKEVDRAAAFACAELALSVARKTLSRGGSLVVKVFKSNESEQFVKIIKPLFNKVIRTELKATRKTSDEFYLLGFGFSGEIGTKVGQKKSS